MLFEVSFSFYEADFQGFRLQLKMNSYQAGERARLPFEIWNSTLVRRNGRSPEPFLRQLSQPMSGQKWSARIKSRALVRGRQLFIHTKTLLKPMTATAADGERCIGTLDSISWKSMDGWMNSSRHRTCAKGRRFDVCKCALACCADASRFFSPSNTCKGIVTQWRIREQINIHTLRVIGGCGLSE